MPAQVDPSTAETIAAPEAAARPPAPELVGQTLGHFKILRPLGRGGMGAVYVAHDESLDRDVALKVIDLDGADAAAQDARFVREARAQARLRHPAVVPIYFIGEGGTPRRRFFAMELVDGESLGDMLARGERLPWARAAELMIEAARALRAGAQQGIVHRDVKPGNLLVERSGALRLCDFGLAKRLEAPGGAERSDVTQHGSILGTPLYISPEQARAEVVDARSDMYSLGATFHHLLVGRPPFEGDGPIAVIARHLSSPPAPLRQALPDAPEAAERILLRLLAKDPADRFADYDALIAALEEARPGRRQAAGIVARGAARAVDLLPFFFLVGPVGPAGTVLPLCVLYGLLEARFGRTPGKWVLKLRTIDRAGGPIGYGRGLGRTVLAAWGPLVVLGCLLVLASLVGHGTVEVGATAGGEGGPELKIDGVSVSKAWAFVLGAAAALALCGWLAGLLAAVLDGERRTVHDRLLRTRVVYDL